VVAASSQRIGPPQRGARGVTHTVDREEIFVVLGGTALATLGSERLELRPGDTFVVPKGELFSIGNPGSAPFEALAVAPVGVRAAMPGGEPFGGTDSEDARARSAGFLDAQLAKGDVRVAVRRDGVLVSLSAFNASLPDIVQLGGIYTPPELRGRGYAKVAVAASLLAAREKGASRAILFTSNPSAVRTYEALGFCRIGDYGLVFLR
jgi:GNAT superfamily N-acetyltransferase